MKSTTAADNVVRFRPSPDTVSGNLQVDPEIFLPTRGPAIHIQSFYNSQSTYNDAFGYGRTISVNLTLVEDTDDSVTLLRGTGNEDTFTLSDGTYVPPVGVFSRLEKQTNQWVETTLDGVKYIYPVLQAGQTSKIQRIEDRNGNQIQWTYTNGSLTGMTDPAGRTVTFSYTNGKLTSITDWASHTTTYTYTGDDLTQEAGPTGATITYTYNTDHLLTSITDPAGDTFSYTYDTQDRVITRTYLTDKTTTYTYDPDNQKTTVTDPLGNATVYEYDAEGNITKVTDAMGNTITYTYQQGMITSRTDPNGNTTTWNYDLNNANVLNRSNLLSLVDALGDPSSFTYNSENDLLTTTDALGNVTRFTYDANGNLLRQVDALGNMMTFTYDRYGQQVEGREVLGYEASEPNYDWVSTSNSLGLTSYNQSVLHQLPFTVNFYGDDYAAVYVCANGFLSFTSDSTSATPVSIPNAAAPNALIAGLWTDLDLTQGGSITYLEDATRFVVSWENVPLAGNASATQTFQVIISKNGNITFQYKTLNSVPTDAVIGIESQEGLTGVQYATNDLTNAKAILLTYSLSVAQYTHDSLGNLSAITDSLSNRTTYSSDAAGKVTDLTDPLSHSSQRTYNTENQIVTKTDALGNVAEFTYNNKGNLTAFADANDKVTAYTHNIFDDITTVTFANSDTINYVYDALGNLIQITDANGNATQYEYDALCHMGRVIDPISLANRYDYRQKITVTTSTAAASVGTSVKIGLDTAPLETAGKLRTDRRDWRVVAYDRVAKVFTELDRDYLSPTETWFSLQSDIDASSDSETSGNHSYYVYYGQANEEGLPPALLAGIYAQGAKTTGTLTRNDLNATFIDEDGFIVDVLSENAPRFYPGHYEGRKALLLEPHRTNFISNSTFEGDISGWSSTHQATAGASRDRSQHGYYSMKVKPSGMNPYVGTAEGTSGISVSSGASYAYSGWVYVPAENSQSAQLEIAWWNVSGSLIRTDQSRVAAKGSWQYLSVTAAAPENTAYPYASVRLRGTGTYAAGDVFYLDAAQFEKSRFPTSYIPTTHDSASRNAERLTYPASGNLQTAQGSISLWVKVEYSPDSTASRPFFDSRTTADSGIYIYRNTSDKLVLQIGNGTTHKESISSGTMNWTTDAWHHIAATWDSQSQKLYLDGTLLASTATPVVPTQFNNNFSIGSNVAAGPAATAFLADAAIYNRVLSATEISTLFNRTAPPHALSGAAFFADFDEHKEGYSREIPSPEPTVTAGSEETTGTPWWSRAASQSTFDPIGNMAKHLDANGNSIRYTYDKLNRITRVQYPKGVDETFTYDALSQRTSVTDAIGTVTYQYDAVGRLTGVTYPGNKTVSYEYDMAGRRTEMTNPDGGVTHYAYDLASGLTSITDPQNFTTRYTYDTAKRLTQITRGNGGKTLYTYDDTNTLIKVENRKSDDTLINRFDYVQDAVGNRTRLTEANGDYTDYTYDDVYQLLSEVKKGSSDSELSNYAYTYDHLGNRLTMIFDTETTNYTYDANNRLLTAGTLRFEYDANGNMRRQTDSSDPTNPLVTQYQYDYENHLTKVTYPDGSKNWFGYGADGIRQTKRTTENAVQFIYDGFDVIQEISNITGQTATEYFYGPRGVIKQRQTSQDRWYLLDGLGSTTALTDAMETVTDTYTYQGFGNRIATTGTTVNPYKYVAGSKYYTDDESGLMLLTLRYYDAAIGRFITRDPASVGPNLYTYASNNPLKYVDPTGLRPMTAAERKWASTIFGEDDALIDYDKVDIVVGGLRAKFYCWVNSADAVTLSENRIYFKESNFSPGLLIHELTHIWQLRTGVVSSLEGLGAHVGAFFTGKNLYAYDISDNRPFRLFGHEQQAQILQDAYNKLPTDAQGNFVAYNDKQKWLLRRLEEFQKWAKVVTWKKRHSLRKKTKRRRTRPRVRPKPRTRRRPRPRPRTRPRTR